MDFTGILIGLMFSPFVLLFCKTALDVDMKIWRWGAFYVAWTAAIGVPMLFLPHTFIRSVIIMTSCFIAGLISGIGKKNTVYAGLNYLITLMFGDAILSLWIILFEDDSAILFAQNMEYDVFLTNFYVWCFYSIANIISCLFFSRKKQTIKKDTQKVSIKSFLAVILFMLVYCFSVFFMCKNFYINYNEKDVRAVAILAILPFVVLVTIGFLLIDKRRKKEHIEEMLELQKSSLTLYENSREFVHDYKNFLLYLQGAMENGESENVYKIVSEKLNDAQDVYNSSYRINLNEVSDSGLRWLLVSKISEAIKKSVSFEVRNVEDTDYIMKKSEFIEMLGILIDNAVEAAEESEKRRVVLDIKKTPCGYTMTVSNTYKTAPDIVRMFDRDYSTKNGHSGIGLNRVRNITDKYDGITLNAGVSEGFFAIHIEGVKNSKRVES